MAMRWPLRLQIMIPMAAAMLAAILGLTAIDAYFAGQRAVLLVQRQVAEVTRTLSTSNFPLTERVLKQMQGLSGAHFVLVDSQGQAITSNSGIDLATLPTSGPEQNPHELNFVETIHAGDGHYYHAVLPLPPRRRAPLGQRLHILYPEHAYRAAWQQAAQPPLIIGSASLGIVALLGLAIASRVSRPMNRLRTQIRHIAEGRFAPVPLPRRNDEVRDLAIDVNRMAHMLTNYEQEIRRTEQIRTLGHLVRGVAHQLRNSATGAQMALDIHRDECSQGRQSESLGVATRQLTLIEKYLRKFLSFDAQAPRTYAPVDFSDLIQGLIPLLQPSAEHVAVGLNVVLPERPLIVEGDRDSLEHVVLNLLLNAIEAAERGRGASASADAVVCAKVSCIEATRFRLSVEDTGKGPTPDIAAKMFTPFVTDKPHGTGLGLPLAKDIIEAHGGRLWWERHEEKTRFTFELPMIPRDRHHVAIAGRGR